MSLLDKLIRLTKETPNDMELGKKIRIVVQKHQTEASKHKCCCKNTNTIITEDKNEPLES